MEGRSLVDGNPRQFFLRITCRARALASVAAVVVAACACACAVTAGRTHGGREGPRPAAVHTAGLTSEPASQPSPARLTVTVKDLRSRKGNLIFGVFTSADGFPNVEKKSVNWQVKPADEGRDKGVKTVTFTADLPPGRYAASVLHDENRNGDMNRNVANIPTEGYGVTNNPKPAFRAATFKEAAFTLPPEGTTKTISLQYF